jgi:pyrimidine operon attenuation protein / uracil phosphoribosyltransferase
MTNQKNSQLIDAEMLYTHLKESIALAIAQEQRMPHLIGVYTGGAWIAERLHADLKLTTPIGFLSSQFHRDDYNQRGLPTNGKPTALNFDINGADIVVVDDILFTGRTVRAVLNELYDYGRAARIEMAVLIDRGGRELPVAARFVGGVHPIDADQSFVLSMTTNGKLHLRTE